MSSPISRRESSVSRRELLRAASAAGATGFAAAVAGCTGDSGDEPTDAPGGADATATDAPTATDPPTATDAPMETPTAAAESVSIEADTHDALGDLLVDGEGRTLYMFQPDEGSDGSACTGGCAEAWPPLTVEAEDAVEAGAGVSADLGTVEREDGSLQVTAGGWPLYYFARDEEPGDATGQEAGNVWFVLRPDGTVLRPTVSVGEHDQLGEILTDAAGASLYMFQPDEGSDGSACTGGCAEAWPPLTVEAEGDLVDSVRADVELGTIEREDGSLQVTAGGWPLYYFARDESPGDATGQEAGNVWFVLEPDGSVLRPTVSVREHDQLGPILTDARGVTLYMFEQDEQGGDASTCTGGCAEAWPPLTVEAEDDLVDSVRASAELGTVERDDGSLQATAAGWPLYYFTRDEGPGDVAGQGANDVWFVLQPDGTVVRADA